MDELLTITFSGPLTIDKERLARRLSNALPHWLEDEATKPVTVAIALNEAPPSRCCATSLRRWRASPNMAAPCRGPIWRRFRAHNRMTGEALSTTSIKTPRPIVPSNSSWPLSGARRPHRSCMSCA